MKPMNVNFLPLSILYSFIETNGVWRKPFLLLPQQMPNSNVSPLALQICKCKTDYFLCFNYDSHKEDLVTSLKLTIVDYAISENYDSFYLNISVKSGILNQVWQQTTHVKTAED